MTYPNHYLLAYGGTILNGNEIWSNSIRFWDKTGADASALIDEESALEHCRGNIATLFGNVDSGMLSTTAVEWIKFNRIGPDGRYESDSESNTLFLDSSPIKGVKGSPEWPPQCTVAITFHTERTRGRASKGRIFIPNPTFGISGLGRISATDTSAMATVYADFIRGLGNWPGLDLTEFVPAVVSGIGDGEAAAITRVSVGDVVDTQRRRRNALIEARSSVDV